MTPSVAIEGDAGARRPPVIRRPRLRWLDVAIVAVLGAALAYVAWRGATVLRYNWNWAPVWNFIARYDQAKGAWVANLLLQGLWTTIRVSIWAGILAAAIGVLMGMARLSHRLFLRLLARSYVEFVRNIPPLVFLFLFYFLLTSQVVPLLGIEEALRRASPATLATIDLLAGPPEFLPAIVSAILCLALFEAAYVTEIVRAGIQSIARGQWEAARSMGLDWRRTMRLVILPQAIQRVVPPLAGQFISLVKDSSIISLVSVQDLTFLGTEVANSTTRIFETWLIVALFYLIICLGLSLAFGRLELKMRRHER